jgi:hypothetical protein
MSAGLAGNMAGGRLDREDKGIAEDLCAAIGDAFDDKGMI